MPAADSIRGDGMFFSRSSIEMSAGASRPWHAAGARVSVDSHSKRYLLEVVNQTVFNPSNFCHGDFLPSQFLNQDVAQDPTLPELEYVVLTTSPLSAQIYNLIKKRYQLSWARFIFHKSLLIVIFYVIPFNSLLNKSCSRHPIISPKINVRLTGL